MASSDVQPALSRTADGERDAAPAAAPGNVVLSVEGLRTEFQTSDGVAVAVDGVSLEARRGETLAIVGESGSGKSVTALSIMRLIPTPPGRIAGGEIRYGDLDLSAISERDIEKIRGNNISMIFQEPMTSLNPVLSIGRQMTEAIETHMGLDRQAARLRAADMLRRVNIPDPEKRLRQYPHQLSGGMLQRVMIAMALSCDPEILIADEPTTALDVTIQSQILDLMRDLQRDFEAAIILITHDMGVVAEMADRVIVMYAGRKVEEASVAEIFARPLHPYTRGLLRALPVLGRPSTGDTVRLEEIPGIVPALTDLPVGCRFAPRCAFATDTCRAEYPPLEKRARGHLAACWHADQIAEMQHP
jgi:oligopeptide/dipeptide ABC transporter ATP-binding protein